MTRQLEPEWDDATRELVDGLAQYEAEKCPGCGFHKSVLDEFDRRYFTFDVRFCPACESQARYARVVADQDDKATPKDAHGHAAWGGPRDPRPDDGRHIYVRELTPAEVEKRKGGSDGRPPRKRSTRPQP